jgi:hypothetical protein
MGNDQLEGIAKGLSFVLSEIKAHERLGGEDAFRRTKAKLALLDQEMARVPAGVDRRAEVAQFATILWQIATGADFDEHIKRADAMDAQVRDALGRKSAG